MHQIVNIHEKTLKLWTPRKKHWPNRFFWFFRFLDADNLYISKIQKLDMRILGEY